MSVTVWYGKIYAELIPTIRIVHNSIRFNLTLINATEWLYKFFNIHTTYDIELGNTVPGDLPDIDIEQYQLTVTN